MKKRSVDANGNGIQDLDQHFTNENTANELVESVLQRLDPTRIRTYLEPSCGSGAFVNALLQNGVPREQIRTVEISEDFPADVHADFLTTTAESLGIGSWRRDTTVVIGNPPFGNLGKTARAFLNKAATYADWVCFVVPRSMYNGNGCSNVTGRLVLMHEKELDSAFDTTNAKCNWQEWFTSSNNTVTRQQKRKRDVDTMGMYELVGKDDHYDVVIQRCGSGAGKVTSCNGTGQGKYYLRSPYREVLLAVHNLVTPKEASLTTHQISISTRMLHEMIKNALLNMFLQQITLNRRLTTNGQAD